MKSTKVNSSFDLYSQENKTEDSTIQCLKAAFQSNVIYSRISDSAMVAMNPYKTVPAQSLQYVAEYKNTIPDQSEQLPTHIFKLTNQAYLHMRRTGIDQSLILSGDSGSGKTETFKLILKHLVHLSSHKKETRLQTQITNVQIVLEAFGNVRTSVNRNASRFGKFVELQFNQKGRMMGTKLLNYLLDKSRIIICPSSEQTFHVFYHLFAGASLEEKQMLQLNDNLHYKYMPQNRAADPTESTQFDSLKLAMKTLGINKKYQAQIWRFLACLLHLGQIEFMDDPTVQESAIVKNPDTLDLCADFLGVDSQALENVLTYKTQWIQKDVATLILNATAASKQRDEIVKALYSLLYTWLVEYINKKLCCEEVHNFIGILDFPGYSSDLSFSNTFNTFCLNLSNERIQHFCQKQIFEIDIEEYQSDGLYLKDVPYFNNQQCVELLIRRKRGIADLINHYSESSSVTSALEMTKAFIKHNGDHVSFSTKQSNLNLRQFSIQHFFGQVTYDTSEFFESNNDILNTNFVHLVCGDGNSPATYNTFLLELFSTDTINKDFHPKQSNAIINTQQSIEPSRKPSMRRSKSTKRRKPMTTDVGTIECLTSTRSKNTSTVLSQLNRSLDDMFLTLDETIPWFVFCIKPNDNNTPNQFDMARVRSQIRALGIPQICDRLSHQYVNFMIFDEFLERYETLLQDDNCINRYQDGRTQCQDAIRFYGWTTQQATLGSSKVFFNEQVWQYLENRLRTIEKTIEKQLKDEKRINENMAALTTPRIYIQNEQSSESLDNISISSNAEFLLPRINTNAYHNTSDQRHSKPFKGVTSSIYTDDQRSFFSEDEFFNYGNTSSYSDCDSQLGEIDKEGAQNTNTELKQILSNKPIEELTEEDNEPVSSGRRSWLIFVWCMTWWIPTPFLAICGKMKRPDIQIAWREKVALCMIIFLSSGFIIWFLIFFGNLICPHQDVFSISELQSHSDDDSAYVAIRGEVFDLTSFAPYHWARQVIPQSVILKYGGKDVSSLFPVQVSSVCQGVTGSVNPYVSLDFNVNLTDTNAEYHNFLPSSEDPRPDWYFQQMTYLRKHYKLGSMGYTLSDVKKQATHPMDISGIATNRQWVVIDNSIYDITYYLLGGRRFDLPEGVPQPDKSELNFLHDSVVTLFSQKSGQDITEDWNALPLDPELKFRQQVCLRNLYFAGKLDQRNSPRCLFAEYLLLIVTIFLCLVVVFKFLAALQFRTRREPEKYEKFVICQVPCYTEGEDELRKTINSISALEYDDKRKLLFIVCDGMIVGGGNDLPTPRIVLDILGVDPNIDPEALSFFSVGEGQKQHNMAKIYSGLYEVKGHIVPYIVIVKVGKPTERQKPGNRGKRDSQLVLMNFLNKVHFNSPMTPFELELYHQIKNVIGVNPSFYEFILMVDADTEVMPDGLNRMISAFTHDSKIIGLCGETLLSNEKDTWVTMIQVYEYFISHYLIKAFESLFGSVTCLPGCFSVYRIRSPNQNKPLLISNQIIEDYSINKVDTLHKKNLLHLGEDRYLTTLILKHFPNYKTKFVSDAKCATNAPDQWSVLLSQRRRWINSTIHNLGELVFLPQLCGFCCFSMRFVVMLDLISTLVQPAIIGYLVYLIYSLVISSSGVPVMSIITIAGVYGLQAIIFLLHRKWEYIIWMLVSIFALPVFSFMIPIYSYWHFDDFSWGNTRVVLGEKGKKVVMADEGKFDRKSIPTIVWDEYERNMYKDDLEGTHYFNDNVSVRSYGSHRSKYSQGSQHTQLSKSGQYNTQPSSPSFNTYPSASVLSNSVYINSNANQFRPQTPSQLGSPSVKNPTSNQENH